MAFKAIGTESADDALLQIDVGHVGEFDNLSIRNHFIGNFPSALEATSRNEGGDTFDGNDPFDVKKNQENIKRFCGMCRQHGFAVQTRGHKCPFKECVCAQCSLVRKRRKVMSQQIRIRRAQDKCIQRSMSLIAFPNKVKGQRDFAVSFDDSSRFSKPPTVSNFFPPSTQPMMESALKNDFNFLTAFPPFNHAVGKGSVVVSPTGSKVSSASSTSPTASSFSSSTDINEDAQKFNVNLNNTAATKALSYYCQKCKNHGILIMKRQHKQDCPFFMCKCEMCQLIETRRVLDQKIKQKRKRAGAGACFSSMNEEGEESITSLLLPKTLAVGQKKYKMEVTDGKNDLNNSAVKSKECSQSVITTGSDMEEQQAISNEALINATNWEKCVLKIAVEMYAKKQGIPRSQKVERNELFGEGVMQSKPISMETNADNARDNGHFPTPPYYTASVSPLTGQMHEKFGAKSVADPIGIAQMMHSFELAKNPYGVGDISTRPMFDQSGTIAAQMPNINSSSGPATTPEIHTENGHKGVIKSTNSKIGIADQKQHSLSTTTSLLHNVQKQLQLNQHSSLNFLNGGETPKPTISSSNQTTADWLNNQLLSLLAAKKAAEEQEQQQQQRRQLEKLLFSAGQQLAFNRKPFLQSPSAENNQIRIDAKSAFSPVHHNHNFHEDKPHRLLREAMDFTAPTMRSSEPPMQRIFDAGIKRMSTEEALLVAKILLENNR